MADVADYSAWRKGGRTLLPARVVGLALELLFVAENEYDLSIVGPSHCSAVQFWSTQRRLADGDWGATQTCTVPVLAPHVQLALYLLRRLYTWIAGLSLVVKDAIVNRSRSEGQGQHDLVLEHAGELARGPFYCRGFIQMEVKVVVAGSNGRRFKAAWGKQKERCVAGLARVLRVPGTPFGAAALLAVGVCDNDDLRAPEPPLFVKMQLLTLDGSGQPIFAAANFPLVGSKRRLDDSSPQALRRSGSLLLPIFPW